MLEPSRWEAQTPPFPSSGMGGESVDQGQKLLAMIRSLENEDNEGDFDRILDDAIETLKKLILLCCRKGLIQGDHQKAELVLSLGGGEAASQDKLQKKRGRKSADQKGRDARQSGESSTAAATIDESLILSAVIRILGLQPSKIQSAMLLLTLSADLCTATSEHLKSTSSKQLSRIGLAEYELISSLGIPLLKGLYKASNQMLAMVHNNNQQGNVFEVLLNTDLVGYDEEIATLQSCLRAAASLVSLFGTKLTRSSGLVSDLQKLGLTMLTFPCHNTQTAAAKLLAALPLTGALYDKKSASNKSIGEQWSDYLMDTVICLTRLLKSIAPVNQKCESVSDSWRISSALENFLGNVKTCFHKAMPQEEQRVSALRVLVHGLSQLIQSVMARDYRCLRRDDQMLLDTRISAEAILNLLDCMLSFSSGSETLYFATKKRLRLEPMEGGVLSPTSIVREVAGYIKHLGHQIFDTLISCMGYPPLLPHSKRMMRTVSRALLTSASSAVQKAVDPSAAAVQLEEGKDRRWLHTSILLRTQAVRSFGLTISMCGLDPTRNNGSSDTSSWLIANKASGAEECVTVVGGCLLEQLWTDKESEEWGTFEERVTLAETAVASLESILLSCGGFMPLSLRLLVDSIAATSLSAILLQDAPPIASSAVIKVSILRLGCACLSVPWPSGASSCIREKLLEASLRCRMHDTKTREAAATALRLCESVSTPRVPALFVDKQVHDFSGSTKPVSASSLAGDIKKVKDELAAREEAAVAELKREKEEKGQRKRKRKVDATEEDRSQQQPSQADLSQRVHAPQNTTTSGLAEKPKIGSSENTEEASGTVASKKMDTADAETNTKTAEEDEDDFLPGIVDDGGPDEEDA